MTRTVELFEHATTGTRAQITTNTAREHALLIIRADHGQGPAELCRQYPTRHAARIALARRYPGAALLKTRHY